MWRSRRGPGSRSKLVGSPVLVRLIELKVLCWLVSSHKALAPAWRRGGVAQVVGAPMQAI